MKADTGTNVSGGIRIHRDCLDAHGNYVPTPAVASGAFLAYLKRTGYFRASRRSPKKRQCAFKGCKREISANAKHCASHAGVVRANKQWHRQTNKPLPTEVRA